MVLHAALLQRGVNSMTAHSPVWSVRARVPRTHAVLPYVPEESLWYDVCASRNYNISHVDLLRNHTAKTPITRPCALMPRVDDMKVLCFWQ